MKDKLGTFILLLILLCLCPFLDVASTSYAATPQIVGGFHHTIALKSDGTLWACGLNDHGQIGDNTTTNRLSPVPIGENDDQVSIAAGSFFTIKGRRK